MQIDSLWYSTTSNLNKTKNAEFIVFFTWIKRISYILKIDLLEKENGKNIHLKRHKKVFFKITFLQDKSVNFYKQYTLKTQKNTGYWSYNYSIYIND